MSTAAANAAKKQRGRPFKPGRTGNPVGKAKGIRHRITVLAEKMMEDDAPAVVTAVLGAAKAGDMTQAGAEFVGISQSLRDDAFGFGGTQEL
jgi:hypothetical protein